MSNLSTSNQAYLGALLSAPLLAADEEQQLIGGLGAQGATREHARAKLRTHYSRLAIIRALKYRRYGVPVLELVEAAQLGIGRALDKYDPQSGTAFSAFAMLWCNAALMQRVSEVRKSKAE